jgi:hypothetical protein
MFLAGIQKQILIVAKKYLKTAKTQRTRRKKEIEVRRPAENGTAACHRQSFHRTVKRLAIS